MMEIFEENIDLLIQNRSSWRSYEPEIISEAQQQELSKLFTKVPQLTPFHSKMRFEWLHFPEIDPDEKKRLGTYGMISGAKSYIVGAVHNKDQSYHDYGYALELIILKATELGLGTCWLGGTFSHSEFSKRIHLETNEFIPAITPVGQVDSRTFKGKFIRFVVRAKHRKKWSKIFYHTTFSRSLQPEDVGKLADAFEWVRLGPSGGNRQRWRLLYDPDPLEVHFYIDRHRTDPEDLYREMQNIDIGIAMAHFQLGSQKHGLEGHWQIHNDITDRIEGEIPEDYEYIVSWVR